MAKPSRGLPPSFRLAVPATAFDAPVQLGEYLDDPPPAPDRPPAARPATHATPPVPVRAAGPAADTRPPTRPRPKPRVNAPRKQLNMNAETLRMVDDLVRQVQLASGQADAKVSELFHGLIGALHEARGHLDLSRVPPRGRWGSASARAFPLALRSAFREAIAEWARRHG